MEQANLSLITKSALQNLTALCLSPKPLNKAWEPDLVLPGRLVQAENGLRRENGLSRQSLREGVGD